MTLGLFFFYAVKKETVITSKQDCVFCGRRWWRCPSFAKETAQLCQHERRSQVRIVAQMNIDEHYSWLPLMLLVIKRLNLSSIDIPVHFIKLLYYLLHSLVAPQSCQPLRYLQACFLELAILHSVVALSFAQLSLGWCSSFQGCDNANCLGPCWFIWLQRKAYWD